MKRALLLVLLLLVSIALVLGEMPPQSGLPQGAAAPATSGTDTPAATDSAGAAAASGAVVAPDGAGANSAPVAAASAAQGAAAAQRSAAPAASPLLKTAAPSSLRPGKLLRSRGRITLIAAASPARHRLERITVSAGSARIVIAINAATIIKNAAGKIVPLSRLRMGQRVIVAYRSVKGVEVAVSIAIQS